MRYERVVVEAIGVGERNHIVTSGELSTWRLVAIMTEDNPHSFHKIFTLFFEREIQPELDEHAGLMR